MYPLLAVSSCYCFECILRCSRGRVVCDHGHSDCTPMTAPTPACVVCALVLRRLHICAYASYVLCACVRAEYTCIMVMTAIVYETKQYLSIWSRANKRTEQKHTQVLPQSTRKKNTTANTMQHKHTAHTRTHAHTHTTCFDVLRVYLLVYACIHVTRTCSVGVLARAKQLLRRVVVVVLAGMTLSRVASLVRGE